jgi:hypothetical protein
MKKRYAMAAALAGVLAAAQTGNAHDVKSVPQAKGAAPKVQCHGINTCKGTTECGVDGAHTCHYQNACKGKGWLTMTEKECKSKKGTSKKL